MDGDESDVDCGGTGCSRCGLGAGCGSALDCASGVCVTGGCVAPANACGVFSGCTTFTDLTDAGPATIRFPVGGDRYSPACARVRFGQSVTFEGGDFSVHTLGQACGPVSGAIGASSGQSFTVTFNRALGIFGYHCSQHGSPSGAGMAGAIEVVR
jgi:plastocyanin